MPGRVVAMGRIGPSVAVGPGVGLAGTGVRVADGAEVNGTVGPRDGVALARSGVEVSVGIGVEVETAATCCAGVTDAVALNVERRPPPVLRIPLASNTTTTTAISARAPSPNKIGQSAPDDLDGAGA